MTKLKIYTNDDRDQYAICVDSDQAMRAETMRGINYPHILGEYDLKWDSRIEELPFDVVTALGLRIDVIEGSDLYRAVCPICGRETVSEWVEVCLCADEKYISAPSLMGDEVCQIGQLHYECETEE